MTKEICECGHSYGDHWESTNAEREGGCSICECEKFKAKKEICENCGQINHPNPLCQKFKAKKEICENKKVEPLMMKVTGEKGEVQFQLYISGEEKVIQHAIKYLQEYLKLIKTKK